jgi:hypothetical protein
MFDDVPERKSESKERKEQEGKEAKSEVKQVQILRRQQSAS